MNIESLKAVSKLGKSPSVSELKAAFDQLVEVNGSDLVITGVLKDLANTLLDKEMHYNEVPIAEFMAITSHSRGWSLKYKDILQPLRIEAGNLHVISGTRYGITTPLENLKIVKSFPNYFVIHFTSGETFEVIPPEILYYDRIDVASLYRSLMGCSVITTNEINLGVTQGDPVVDEYSNRLGDDNPHLIFGDYEVSDTDLIYARRHVEPCELEFLVKLSNGTEFKLSAFHPIAF